MGGGRLRRGDAIRVGYRCDAHFSLGPLPGLRRTPRSNSLLDDQLRVQLPQPVQLLDDVDAIRLEVQAKLVRVLQTRACKRVRGHLSIPIDVRLIAATRQSLSTLVAAGRFREDLYRKLNVAPVQVPALRERAEDIPLLVEHFLQKFSIKSNRKQLSISPEALAKLQQHSWPGNVRELELQLDAMVRQCKGDRLDAAEVPNLAVSNGTVPLLSLRMEGIENVDVSSILGDLEGRLIQWAMERAEGDVAKAAVILNLPQSTLQDKISHRSP